MGGAVPTRRNRTARQNRHADCGCETHARPRHALAVDPQIKTSNLKRLRRIAGQVRGLERMVGEDRYCADVLIQIASVQEALRAVGRGLMQNHLKHCVSEAIRKGSPGQTAAIQDELLSLMYRYLH
jgi:CsoR family transcriptional regulator, copper-sensing transcriptional repressor